MFAGLALETVAMNGQAQMFCSLGEWEDIDDYLWLRRRIIYRKAWTPEARTRIALQYGYEPKWWENGDCDDY